MPKLVNHDQRRREIIEACWRVLTEQGSDGLTMRKIAEGANCAVGRITHYFANREALIAAAIHASFDDFKVKTDAILAMDLTAIEKLQLVSDELFPADSTRLREARVWLTFWNQAAMHKMLADENDLWDRGWHQDLVPLMAELNPSLDAELEAGAYIALANGLNIQVAIRPTKNIQELALRTLNAHVARLSEY